MNRCFAGLTAALLGLAAVVPLSGADLDQATAVAKGKEHFKIFCTNCHGNSAEGDGPLVPMLKIKPSDLTLLQQQGGGHFDAERVLKAIDGRHEVSGGERQMPVFSDNLAISTIIEIIEYLKTIQK